MRRTPAWIGLWLMLGCGAGSAGAGVGTSGGAAPGGLPGGVFELVTLDPAGDFADLEPFGRLIGDARVVGLGESAHDAGGFLQARHRLIRYLVERLGFRAVAFETEWVDVEIVDDYVRTCEGDPEDVVRRGMRGVWRSREVADLVAWLCKFNRERGDDRVVLFAFNNFGAWHDAPVLIDFAARVLPERAEALAAGLRRCEGATAADEDAYRAAYAPPVDEQAYAGCIAALDELDAFVRERGTEIPAEQLPEDLELLEIRLAGLRGWEDYQRFEPLPEGLDSRDAAMARIFLTQWRRHAPDARVVLAAHSMHLGTDSASIRAVFPPPAVEFHYWEGVTRMGTHLQAELGDAYFPLSLVGYRTAVAQDFPVALPGDLPLPEGPPVVESLLHGLGRPLLLVDLAYGAADALVRAGERHRLCYVVDAETTGVFESVPSTRFRALVYLDESPPLQPLTVPDGPSPPDVPGP